MGGWTMGAEAWIWMGVWVAVLLIVVALLVHEPRRDAREDACAILRARFARGEITEEELRHALAAVAADEPGASPTSPDPGGEGSPIQRTGEPR